MQIKTILTNRLILRQIDESVFEYIYENHTISDQLDFFGLTSIDVLKKEKEKFDKGLSSFNKHFLYFHLLDKTTERVIGWCGYHTWYIDHRRAEIGYGLFQDEYKNQGLMSEAMKAILDFGFNEMDLNRVEAFIGTENIPSLKLVKKYGFVREGCLRKHYFTNNRMEDSVVFGLLKEEYRI